VRNLFKNLPCNSLQRNQEWQWEAKKWKSIYLRVSRECMEVSKGRSGTLKPHSTVVCVG